MIKLLLLTALLTLLPPSLASECKSVLGCYICGRAINNTPWNMAYTTTPSCNEACKASEQGVCTGATQCCQMYNWKNGEGAFGDAFALKPTLKLVDCKHENMGPNSSKGGNTCTKKNRLDIDAITFVDRDFYIERPQEKLGERALQREGPVEKKLITKGMWVKINSMEYIQCRKEGEVPHCKSGWLAT